MLGIQVSIKCCIAVGLAAMLIYAQPCRAQDASLHIRFEHYAGDSVLVLDKKQYTNALQQPLTISMFKYYISNIKLESADGSVTNVDDYFLVNEDIPESKDIILSKLPKGLYKSISFILGVDSLHNCSGAQTGALDPVNGMFWAWNTGYIFIKLEGIAAASKSPGHIFEYHIGGYRAPTNAIRQIRLSLGKNGLSVGGDTAELKIKVDALQLLKEPVSIDFAKLSSVTDAHNATMVADNYIDMFSIIE